MTASGARSAGTSTVVTAASGNAVHVGGPVEQLGGRDALRDQPEKRQFNVTAAEHRAGAGMLETRRWVVERVVVGELRADAPLQFFVLRLADPFGAGSRSRAAQVHTGHCYLRVD